MEEWRLAKGWLLAGGGIVQLYIHRHEALSFMDGLPFSEWLLNDIIQLLKATYKIKSS